MKQNNRSTIQLGETLFNWRDYTPIPIIIILLFTADPSNLSATLGTILLIAGELFRIYSVAFIGTVSRTRSRSTGGSLITNGPFALVRNPLYIGNFFIVFGFAVYGGVLWVIALTVMAFIFQYYFIVKFEESLLLEKFGEEYAQYCNNVPAFIPKRLPSIDNIVWPQSITPALRSEKRTLTAIGVLLALLALFT